MAAIILQGKEQYCLEIRKVHGFENNVGSMLIMYQLHMEKHICLEVSSYCKSGNGMSLGGESRTTYRSEDVLYLQILQYWTFAWSP